MRAELVELPSFYAEPGFLLLARSEGAAVGCVGIRDMSAGMGEVRRLFVDPVHRTRGLGRSLLDEATRRARRAGYTSLVMTTLPSMTSARRLYDEDGYVVIDPYVPDPVDGVQFLGRDLQPFDARRARTDQAASKPGDQV